DDCGRVVRELRLLRTPAADLEHFFLNFFDTPDRQLGILRRVDEVLPARVDGDAALGDDYIDQLARSSERGDFVNDHRDAIAERRQRQDRASGEKTVLPSTYTVQQAA